MPSYEAEVQRGGVNVRVVIDIDEAQLSYPDADENGERAGSEAVRIMRAIHDQMMPF